MPAESPIRDTSFCASPALGTSKATMRRSRIPEDPGSAIAQIHNAVPNVRSPIIDPDNDPLAVFQVRHFYESSQWKLPVSGSELEHVKVFTARCGSTVELLAIPGGGSNLIGFLFSL